MSISIWATQNFVRAGTPYSAFYDTYLALSMHMSQMSCYEISIYVLLIIFVPYVVVNLFLLWNTLLKKLTHGKKYLTHLIPYYNNSHFFNHNYFVLIYGYKELNKVLTLLWRVEVGVGNL